MSTLGGYLEYIGNVQYIEEISWITWRNIMSTLGDFQYIRGTMSTSEEFMWRSQLIKTFNLYWEPHCTEHPPMYAWYPPAWVKIFLWKMQRSFKPWSLKNSRKECHCWGHLILSLQQLSKYECILSVLFPITDLVCSGDHFVSKSIPIKKLWICIEARNHYSTRHHLSTDGLDLQNDILVWMCNRILFLSEPKMRRFTLYPNELHVILSTTGLFWLCFFW